MRVMVYEDTRPAHQQARSYSDSEIEVKIGNNSYLYLTMKEAAQFVIALVDILEVVDDESMQSVRNRLADN